MQSYNDQSEYGCTHCNQNLQIGTENVTNQLKKTLLDNG